MHRVTEHSTRCTTCGLHVQSSPAPSHGRRGAVARPGRGARASRRRRSRTCGRGRRDPLGGQAHECFAPADAGSEDDDKYGDDNARDGATGEARACTRTFRVGTEHMRAALISTTQR